MHLILGLGATYIRGFTVRVDTGLHTGTLLRFSFRLAIPCWFYAIEMFSLLPARWDLRHHGVPVTSLEWHQRYEIHDLMMLISDSLIFYRLWLMCWCSLGEDDYPLSTHYLQLATLGFAQTDVMMTSSNGNVFRVIDPLWWESTGHRCGFPSQRPVARSFDILFDLHLNKRLSKQDAIDLRRHRVHYGVTVMVLVSY